MPTKRFSAADRKRLIHTASQLPQGSEERRAILAGLREAGELKKARSLPSGFLRDVQKLPEYKKLLKAVRKSRDLAGFLEESVKSWAEDLNDDNFVDADEDGMYRTTPTPPSVEDLLEEGVTYIVFENARDLDRPTKEFEKALGALAVSQGVQLRPHELMDETQDSFLDKVLLDAVEDEYPEDSWKDLLDEIGDELADQAEERRDPMGYRGVSWSDF